MIRVPGTAKNLQELRAEGADVRIVYSTQDALELARKNPDQEVVFLGVGFETTAPTVAVSLEIAHQEEITNYSVLSMHKVVPPALRLLAEDDALVVNAFLDPGHVCAMIGIEPIEFMAKDYGLPGVVTGFEADEASGTLYDIFRRVLCSLLPIRTKERELMERILLAHGSGGRLSHELIKTFFQKHLGNLYLDQMNDASLLPGQVFNAGAYFRRRLTNG